MADRDGGGGGGHVVAAALRDRASSLQDLRRVNRAVNIRDTAETKEDQVLRRVRFVDLRRTAGLYCGAFLVNTRPSEPSPSIYN